MFPLNIKPTLTQSKVLETGPNLIVYGPAGSGKTMLTILLAEKLKTNNPSLKIEIIVFTKSLGKFIRKSLADRGLADVDVRHYINVKINYEIIDITIIDEGQDFGLSQIKWMINRSKNGIYLLGDTNQDVYEFNKNDIRFSEVNQHLKFNEIYLDEVLRFSSSIDAFIKSLFPNIRNKLPRNILNNIKPSLIRCSSRHDQASKINKYFNTIEKGTTAIMVLFNEEVLKLKEELISSGFKIDGYKFTTEDQLSTGDYATNILTYHSAKGLEFDNIILPNLEQGSSFHNNIYYVGISRAKKNVGLFYLDQFPVWIKLNDPSVFEGELYRDIESLKKDVLLHLNLYVSMVNVWIEHGFSIEYAKKQQSDNEKEIITETTRDLIDIGLSEKEAVSVVNSVLLQIGSKV